MSLPRTTGIEQTLEEVFGWREFRQGQAQVIRAVLDGKSALAVFPTGSGKSLCYQLPALHLKGLTLVVSPLVALMKDQIDYLRGREVPAARIDSSVGLEEFRQTNAALRDGTLKLLYVAPERFSNERFIQRLRNLRIDMMVIDEAHCISEWGHNFRPDYLKLARFARTLRAGRVLGLTATATPAVARDICREFQIAPDAHVHTGFHRPNLILRTTGCRPREKTALLLERLRSRPPGPAIVYVTLQRTAEHVAAQLSEQGLPARAYHAGMKSEERATVQDWFMASGEAVVVATIAFGMGIDKANIRYVYHFNLPKSLENYSQEIGRAGRDGAESTCEMLVSRDDAVVLENFTYGDTPERADTGALIDHVLAQPETFDVSIHALSGSFDMRPLVVNTLLTYLELEGVIAATAPFYSEYGFQPARSSREILAKFDEERARFLKCLFATAVKGRTWFSIELEKAGRALDVPREKIIAALNYLEEQGDLTLRVAGVRQGYRVIERPVDASALKDLLIERFEAREKSDVARVRQMLELATAPGCLVRPLLAHFGEALDGDCGHCGRCLGDAPAQPGQIVHRAPDLSGSEIETLRAEHPKALDTPRRLARFLCGLTSPRLTRNKLTKHPLFGSMATIPFADVHTAAAAL